MNSREFREQFHFYVRKMKEKGSNVGRFGSCTSNCASWCWTSRMRRALVVVPVMLRRDDTMSICVWSRATSFHSWKTFVISVSECRKCKQPSIKASFPLRWGAVIFWTKEVDIETSRPKEATSGLVLILRRLRDGCWMTQDVVFTKSFFVSICLLLHPRPKSIKSWLQHALKKASKP